MRARRATPWLGPAGKNVIDFPCSYSWRAYYQETFYGEYLPHIDMQETPPQDVEIRYIHHNVNDTRRVFAKLNALDGAIKYLLKDKEKQKGGKGYKYT